MKMARSRWLCLLPTTHQPLRLVIVPQIPPLTKINLVGARPLGQIGLSKVEFDLALSAASSNLMCPTSLQVLYLHHHIKWFIDYAPPNQYYHLFLVILFSLWCFISRCWAKSESTPEIRASPISTLSASYHSRRLRSRGAFLSQQNACARKEPGSLVWDHSSKNVIIPRLPGSSIMIFRYFYVDDLASNG